MPTLFTLGSMRLRMFADDHHPPHFHLVTPDHEALVRLSDLSVIAGSIDRRSYEAACHWAEHNREFLDREWRRLNER